MNRLFIIALLMALPFYSYSQYKVERPYQFQLNFSGAFLKTFGNTLADPEVENIDVIDWGIPGLCAGYHFNKKYYAGYSFQPDRKLILEEPWTFSDGDNDGNISVDHHTGHFHTLEFRWSPLANGLYVSGFATHINTTNYIMDFQRIDSTMHLGIRDYASDVTAKWIYKEINTLGLGIGYNYISSKAFSFNVGIGIPITINETFHQQISLESQQGIQFAIVDKNSGIDRIREEQFYYPIQFYFNIGYNLKRIFTKRNPFS